MRELKEVGFIVLWMIQGQQYYFKNAGGVVG
jgi:hypothetical protein